MQFIITKLLNKNTVYFVPFNAVFNFHNMSASVDADCVAQLRPSNEEWKCFFAEFLIPYVESPIFAINAFHDTSSLLLIFRECESFVECSAGDLSFQEVLKAIREVCDIHYIDVEMVLT